MAHYRCNNCKGDMTKGEMVDYGTLCGDCFHDYKEDGPVLLDKTLVDKVLQRAHELALDKRNKIV